MIYKKIKRLQKTFKIWLQHKMSKPNREAIFIFGFQKSGTSAIAGLLAHATGSTVTIDTKYLWRPYSSWLKDGSLCLKNHVNKYSLPFSKDIIKDPGTTFFIDIINEYFFLNKYIFLVRNPFDNIRSILNRLGLSGDQTNINLNDVPEIWRYIFPDNGENYISNLAERWLLCNDQFGIIRNDKCIFIKYEDFIKNKEKFVNDLSLDVGLDPKHSIKDVKNNQYQPKGNQEIKLIDFFGKDNYKLIYDKCNSVMVKLEYDLEEFRLRGDEY